MPSFEEMKNRFKTVNTLGQQLKQSSDMIMDLTFDNDIATRQCYLYDYYHDNNKELLGGYNPLINVNGETIADGNKMEVKLKFLIKEYKSASKDDSEYHIQFTSNDWNNQKCVPSYFNEYKKYGVKFPVGLYCDIPDDRGIYYKWFVFYDEPANQFPKFGVLRCNYLFQWITDNGANRYKRFMCGVERTQSSYTSGVWSGDKYTVFDEQGKFWLPWNPISAELEHDQRLAISMLQEKPFIYQISKVKNTSPKGVIAITLKQTEFNQFTDYVNLETGEMYADYYKSTVKPTDELMDDPSDTKLILSTTTYNVAKGGSKHIVAKVVKDDKEMTYTDNLNWNIYYQYKSRINKDKVYGKILINEDLKNIWFKTYETSGDYDEKLDFVLSNDAELFTSHRNEETNKIDDYVNTIIIVECLCNGLNNESLNLDVT